MPEIVLALHNIRSCHNVGSILRTAEAFGLKKIICSGYTPYPNITGDVRLPHIKNKLSLQIAKTSLGAEEHLQITHYDDAPIEYLKSRGYKVVALEQSPNSLNIHSYRPTAKMVLLLGEEVNGVSSELLNKCDEVIEIPMKGKKESFNVSVATGIALYALTT